MNIGGQLTLLALAVAAPVFWIVLFTAQTGWLLALVLSSAATLVAFAATYGVILLILLLKRSTVARDRVSDRPSVAQDYARDP